MDDINFQLSLRLKDQNHVETFTLLPSKMLSENHNVEETANSKQTKYQSDTTNDGCNFCSESKRWYKFWIDKVKRQQDQPDSIIEMSEFADKTLFQIYAGCC